MTSSLCIKRSFFLTPNRIVMTFQNRVEVLISAVEELLLVFCSLWKYNKNNR